MFSQILLSSFLLKDAFNDTNFQFLLKKLQWTITHYKYLHHFYDKAIFITVWQTGEKEKIKCYVDGDSAE